MGHGVNYHNLSDEDKKRYDYLENKEILTDEERFELYCYEF